MKMLSICEDEDICTGLRLVGIEGTIAHDREEFVHAFKQAIADQETAIIIISKKLAHLHAEEIKEARLGKAVALIVEI